MNGRSIKLLIGIVVMVSLGMIITLLSYDRALTDFSVRECRFYEHVVKENAIVYLKRCGKEVNPKKDKFGFIIEKRRFYPKQLQKKIVQAVKESEGDEENFKLFDYGYLVSDSAKIIVAKYGNINKLKKNENYKDISYKNVGVNRYNVTFYFEKRSHVEYRNIINYLPAFIFLLMFIVLYIYVLKVIIDASRLRQIRTDYAHYMTHELKTPVSSISLATQMLQDLNIEKKPETTKRMLGIISEETKRLKFQINKALQVSLMSKDKSNFDFENFELNEVLKSVMKTFDLKMESYGGSFSSDFRAKNDLIYASKMHITNLVSNLLDNAVKYRNQNRPLIIKLTTKNVNNSVLLTICDNGIGIKKEYLSKIFDKYFRVRSDNAENIDGFGLGLSYVKLVVESHGGTISVNSKVNEGTKFIINLPTIKKKI